MQNYKIIATQAAEHLCMLVPVLHLSVRHGLHCHCLCAAAWCCAAAAAGDSWHTGRDTLETSSHKTRWTDCSTHKTPVSVFEPKISTEHMPCQLVTFFDSMSSSLAMLSGAPHGTPHGKRDAHGHRHGTGWSAVKRTHHLTNCCLHAHVLPGIIHSTRVGSKMFHISSSHTILCGCGVVAAACCPVRYPMGHVRVSCYR